MIPYTRKMTTELLNLTPHHIVIYPDEPGAKAVLYEKSGIVARLDSTEQTRITTLADGCPVFTPQLFTGLVPSSLDGREGVIVSMVVGEYLSTYGIPLDWKNVIQVYVADTSPQGAVRNENGAIIGSRRLVQYV